MIARTTIFLNLDGVLLDVAERHWRVHSGLRSKLRLRAETPDYLLESIDSLPLCLAAWQHIREM